MRPGSYGKGVAATRPGSDALTAGHVVEAETVIHDSRHAPPGGTAHHTGSQR